MPEQYAATDTRTGLEVVVTGDFPEDPDDRVRIARTTTLFTRLMSTILAMENQTEQREGFRAIETQLEVAEALLRRDIEEVQRLIRTTLETMGITEERLAEIEAELRRHLEEFGGFDLPPSSRGRRRRSASHRSHCVISGHSPMPWSQQCNSGSTVGPCRASASLWMTRPPIGRELRPRGAASQSHDWWQTCCTSRWIATTTTSRPGVPTSLGPRAT